MNERQVQRRTSARLAGKRPLQSQGTKTSEETKTGNRTALTPEPPTTAEDIPEREGVGTYVVDKLVGFGDDEDESTPHVLVQWVGYSRDEATWEPVTSLDYNLVKRFCIRQKFRVPPVHLWDEVGS